MDNDRDYGWCGRLGLGTPQANPTVEAEMRRLVPHSVEYLTVRLTSSSDDPAQRLRDYLMQLPDYLARFASLKLDGFMFACTASSYLLTADELGASKAKAESVLDAPVTLAADALERVLHELGGGRIGLLSPYPQWLHEQAIAYWQSKGFDVAATRRIDTGSDDTYSIYTLPSSRAVGELDKLGAADVDIVMIAGTGMPTLPVQQSLLAQGKRIVSSNVALARVALEQLGQDVTSAETWWHRPHGEV